MIKQIAYSIRNLKKSKLLLFISVPSLIIGLSVFLLLIIYIKHETSYDKYFPNRNRVVRLYNTIIENGESSTWPICLRRAHTEIPPQIPEIEASTQLYRGWDFNVSYQKQKFSNIPLLYADKDFLKVFGLKLIAGYEKNALSQKNSIIIVKSLAEKIFGNNDCVGKVITLGDDNFTIEGLIDDFPTTTHFSFDILASMSSINAENFQGMEFFTYFLLSENSNFETVENKIASLNTKIIKNQWSDNPALKIESGVDKLENIHLYTHADWDISSKGNLTNIYIVGFLAFLLLFTAVVNHINLYMLHGEKRFFEIGIRKSLGASKKDLVKIFYSETALLTAFSFFIALLLANASIDDFAQLMRLKLSFSEIINPEGIFILSSFLIVLIFLTGAYPSEYLSKLPVINAISGNNRIKRKNRLSIISVLVQFSISVFLIVSLLILNGQLSYLKSVPLGFNSNDIIEINGFDKTIEKSSEAICEELEKLSFVSETAKSTHRMGGGSSGQRIYVFGNSNENAPAINEYRVNGGFCKLMNLELSDGRYFNKTEDDKRSIIINQAAARMLQLSDPVGKQLVMHNEPFEIIGLANDFYYIGHSGWKIGPLAITAYDNSVNNIYLKTRGDLNKHQKNQISNIFRKFNSDYTFQYSKLEETYKKKFYNEDRLMKLLLYGTLLAIIISFAGMFALSVYNVEKRTKEIGVRKILGSTSSEIVLKLLKDTLKWVIISMPLAFLMSYIVMKEWLKDFANKIDINILYFIIGGVIALLIATIAVSLKTWQASRKNPVDSLRYE